jgi:hypothetical protein
MVVWLDMYSEERKQTPTFPLCGGVPELSGDVESFRPALGVCGRCWSGWICIHKNENKSQPFRFAVVFQSNLVM